MPDTSTAQMLIEFRKELMAGGFDEDTASQMARDASARLIQAKGLAIKPPTDSQ